MSPRVDAGADRLVTDVSGLEQAARSAKSAGVMALDTEFLREKTYRARLCLVQIATAEGLWLIDPTLDIDLSSIGSLIADPAVEVVVHAGKQDFEIFYEAYGSVPRNVFDVQVAAGFAGHGASLPYGRLVESVVRVTLVKGESYSDWCRRPLSDAQLRYAADDVRYLLETADRLKTELQQLARLQWAGEEMSAFEAPGFYGADVREVWRKVAGRGSLNGRQLAILRELAGWREEAARHRDLPRGWVVKDPTLVEVARRAPTTVGRLKAIRGFNAREADRSGRPILEAIERGKASKPPPEPSMPPRSAQTRARMLAGLADAILKARCEEARIATELVSTRAELESLLAQVVTGAVTEESPDQPEARLLRGWRRDLAGNAIIALARGRIALRAIDSPPFIEEVLLEG